MNSASWWAAIPRLATRSSIFFLFFGLLLGSLVPGNKAIAALADDSAPNLFTWIVNPPNLSTKQLLASRPEIMRSHLAQIHLDHLVGEGLQDSPQGGEYITLNLFNDVKLIAIKDRLDRRSITQYSWFGHIADLPHSQVILVVEQGGMAGNIMVQDEHYGVQAIYQIRPAPGGLHEISQIDQSAFPECGNTEAQSVNSPSSASTPDLGLPQRPQADDGSNIDIMIIYTGAARQAVTNIAAEIQLGIDETNQSYANSGIQQRIRLVHQAEVNYNETGVVCDSTLNRLTGTNDGFLDNIHAIRDARGADIVSLWVEDTGAGAKAGSCGCGKLMSKVSADFAALAFNVVRRDCATGNYSFGHEMGHNMGARHDWFVDQVTTPYSYAHGYVDTTHRWRTIMAYNVACGDQNPCTRIQHWSNPTVNFSGNPTGIAEGQTNPADNRRTLNNTASVVANFRQTVSPPPPPPPTSISIFLPAILSIILGEDTPVSYRLTVNKVGNNHGAGTVTSDPAGINCGSTCSADFNSGVNVTLTPTPATDSTFGGWSGACTNATGNCVVSMTAVKSVIATFNGTARLLLAGLASSGQIYYTANLTTWAQIPGGLAQLQIGDLNGDGQADLAGLAGNGAIWYTTNLNAWTQVPGGLAQLRVGDLNGDDQADLAGLASNGTIWYTTNLSTWTQVPGGLAQLRVGDLNGDGKADLAGLASNGTIWYTTNLSTWTQVPGGLAQLQIGDLNGDGKVDLAGLASNGTIWYSTNLSTWTQVPGGLAQLQIGDLNGDGKADLAGLASNGSIWYSTNLSTWTQISGALSQLVARDLNGNGKADLAGLASNGSIWYSTNLSGWTNIPGQLNRLAGSD